MLQDIPILPTTTPTGTPAMPDVKAELAELKGLTLQEFIDKIARDIVEFAFHLVIAALVFYAGKFIIGKLVGLATRIMARRKVEQSLATFVLSLMRIVLYFILIVTVIGILGINTSSFLALFASAGVAIGMALSGTLQNFAGGVLILLLKPYRVGDYIEAQGYAGTVREIQIFHTIITTPDNKGIIIPNGGLSTGSINNWSREALRRVSWSVGLSYGDDVDVARRVLLEMANSDPRVVHTEEPGQSPSTIPGLHTTIDRSPSVVVDQLADSAIVVQLRAWTHTSDYWDLYYELNERIYKELPAAGLHFPFPQMDVHISQQ